MKPTFSPFTLALLALSAASLGLTGCATQQAGSSGGASSQAAANEPPPRYGWETFRQSNNPDVILAGMPSDEALDIFAARGGTTVINLRTDSEMAAFPGYQQSIEARGLKYVHVPTSGSTMGEATYDPMAAALDEATGPVLLHCASGGRATYAWAMRRIDHEGLSAQDASVYCTETRGKPWEKGNEILAAFAESRATQ